MAKTNDEIPRARRGFAALDPETRRHIAALCARACNAASKGHCWTHEDAQHAGRKGGLERVARSCREVRCERGR